MVNAREYTMRRMSAPDPAKLPVKMLKALFWAEWHMREAHAACVHLSTLGKTSPELRHSIFTGIVVSYARPFGENNGLSAIGAKFSKFPSKAARLLHGAILEARDLLYAHNDRQTIPKYLAAATSPARQNDVGIHIKPNGNASWNVARSGFDFSQAHEIGALSEFQIDRIHAASTRMLQRFSRGNAYRPGDYTLGVDFP
jgi:hypothetical protein